MAIKAQKSTEPIAGYHLEKRIGAGGYGEVWSAVAPGGLSKAIKFVYGFLDDERAAREMKALTRIKEVRHPFLLSLERIEVIEGQLLIVTELADGSLKDRFDECKENGLAGIPREELLMYMSDAADALDYMSEKYSLQHLDVKPENLLLVGGRVKVADFGLVKELHDVTGSLMGGLTPLYAPPESFDGKPSMYSDQYSLAVLYQEMLTGVLPFPGTTAAQLANQHLHSKPRISALPQQDQPSIARALAKNPTDRFESCRQLVAAITRGVADAPAQGEVQGADTDQAPRDNRPTNKPSAPDTADRRNNPLPKVSGSLLPTVESSPQFRRGTPIVLDNVETKLRPTLMVGIGGVGSRVLLNLRHRLRDRLGDANAIPALQMLLIDTDAKDLAKTTHGGDGACFDQADTLPMPLKRPQDYRNASKKLTQSLSRRWLYNLPRSLQTEGMRPLGRLALVDHGEQLFERLRAGLRAIVSPESVARSAKSCRMEFHAEAPQVIVVASIDGGTGSGMAVDVGYSIRFVLRELELNHADLYGVLLHATGRNPSANDLAIANAFSCLRELAHHGRSDHRYSGDPSLDIGAFEKGKGAFDSTYLIHFGEELSDEQFSHKTEQVAEYLYLDTVTPSSALFEKLREDHSMARADTTEEMQIRTFGLCHVGMSNGELLSASTDALCKRVVQGWLGDFVQPDTNSTVRSTSARSSTVSRANLETKLVDDLGQAGAHHAKQIGLALDAMCDQVHSVIREHLGVELNETLKGLVAGVKNGENNPAVHTRILNEINFHLGYEDEEGNLRESPILVFPRELLAKIDDHVQQLSDQTVGWVLSWLNDPKCCLRGAQQATRWCEDYLTALRDQSEEAEGKLVAETAKIQDELTRPIATDKKGRTINAPTPEIIRKRIQEFASLRLFGLAFHGLRRIVSAVRTRIKETSEQLHDLLRHFDQLVEVFSSGAELVRLSSNSNPSSDADTLAQSLAEQVSNQLSQLVIELDKDFRDDFLSEFGGLPGIIGQEISVFKGMASSLRRSARGVIMVAQANNDIIDLMLPPDEDPEQSARRLCRVVESATPKLMSCGGARRLLLIVPKNSNYQRLQEFFEIRLEEPVSIAFNNVGDAVICCEMAQMPVSQVAATIVENRPDYAEIASRLHTRNDITWSPW